MSSFTPAQRDEIRAIIREELASALAAIFIFPERTTNMRSEQEISIALDCLKIAAEGLHGADNIVEGAGKFYAFVTGTQTQRDTINAALDAAGVK